jgi:hypothetical protein
MMSAIFVLDPFAQEAPRVPSVIDSGRLAMQVAVLFDTVFRSITVYCRSGQEGSRA